MKSKQKIDFLEYEVTGACIEVHKALGPGLLESTYKRCLTHELKLRGINFEVEKEIRFFYKDNPLDIRLRADFFIEESIVLEIKTVETLLPIHTAQLLTYMKLLAAPKGLLINFNCTNIVSEGKIPYVNEFFNLLD